MDILVGLLLLCASWAVVAYILIAINLEKRGQKVSFLELRWLVFSYLDCYNELTRQETGRTGPLFYHFVAPLNMAAVLVIWIMVIAR